MTHHRHHRPVGRIQDAAAKDLHNQLVVHYASLVKFVAAEWPPGCRNRRTG